MRKSRTFFLVRIPIQNPSRTLAFAGHLLSQDTCFRRTLAFADYKRSEVGRELTISYNKVIMLILTIYKEYFIPIFNIMK
jgi:hypothetical protein